MSEQWMFYFDPNRCIGCHACSVACKQRHDRDADADDWRTVSHLSRGEYPDFEEVPISMSCMHCHDAPCEQVCPPDAIIKRDEDGIVTVDRDRCIGCHYCAWACPFGAPTYDDEGLMSKCNLCLGEGPGGGHGQPERQTPEDGGPTPACVDDCVGEAIKAGPQSEVMAEATEKAAERFEQGAYGKRVIVEPLEEDADLADAIREGDEPAGAITYEG
ncbi:4Fe-4S dicluster domain-containing protein [Natrarchaeobaculum sulfurireducens]|uniref:Fe-S-cluster-containing dehydrogenase component n=2 Tax=Natrarchaeobaculum sulfurireducens TaxID=2044521 RepID=A0A346PCY9_9EURY|nr:4Fe-4S dicluster domain-containing protein [Natrarchaeobaculum sulfurireducens]AXR77384.1 Fe-S-cluster-containing dehydrogenase component [Natrarchaeobaculum sulfurireducens]